MSPDWYRSFKGVKVDDVDDNSIVKLSGRFMSNRTPEGMVQRGLILNGVSRLGEGLE